MEPIFLIINRNQMKLRVIKVTGEMRIPQNKNLTTQNPQRNLVTTSVMMDLISMELARKRSKNLHKSNLNLLR